jgi:hypothetical protein
MDKQRLVVDALRRDAILIAKLSLGFQPLGFLEIRKSTTLRLQERIVAMVPPGTLVEVIRVSAYPREEMGVAVVPVSFVEGMRILRGHAPICQI